MLPEARETPGARRGYWALETQVTRRRKRACDKHCVRNYREAREVQRRAKVAVSEHAGGTMGDTVRGRARRCLRDVPGSLQDVASNMF